MAEDKKSIPRRQAKPHSGKGVSKKDATENTKVIHAAHLQFKQQLEKTRQQHKYADMESIHAILSEYMGPFLLLGFDLNNESVEISNINNSMEKDAINSHLKRVFVERVIEDA